jgi:4-amino-4-deoxy-L-arabinose transferase-like glycosyltransferase
MDRGHTNQLARLVPGAPAGVTVLDGMPEAEPATSHKHGLLRLRIGASDRPSRRGPAGGRWSLALVLTVQAGLSLRLVWSNTAFQDEALYLRAGHLEWAHWLHGAPIPNFAAYFSGAPTIYPSLGALADGIGGLTAARVLSLLFMLGVTALLWATTRQLYGQRAALLAAGMFATLAGNLFLGAFATYDAMALFLLALGGWLGVRSVACELRARTALLVLAGSVLAMADAVKYATAIFTPVVLAVVAIATWQRRGARVAVAATVTALCTWLAVTAAAIVVGGSQYWLGIKATTLDRPQSNVASEIVVQRAYTWMSLILVLAALGAVLGLVSKKRGRILPAVLAAAALVVPADQAWLHTTISLQKHVVFGAWFAAIAAGYAMARLSRVDPGRGWAVVMAIPIAAAAVFGSIGQADSLYRVWPDSASVVQVLSTAVAAHPGNYLADDYDVEAYYLRTQVPWQRWSSTFYFRYPRMQPGAASYRTAIEAHYFSLVILNFGDAAHTDREIVADMRRAGGYVVLAQAGQFTVWVSTKLQQSRSPEGRYVSY